MNAPKKPKRAWRLAAAGALVAAGGAAWLLSGGDAPLAQRLNLSQREALRCEPEAGMHASYRTRMHTQLKINAATLLSDPRVKGQTISSDAGFNARLRVTALERRGQGMLVALQLDELEAVAGIADASTQLLAELKKPFFAVLARDCSFAELGFDKDLSSEAVNQLRGFVHGFSLSLSDDANKLAWVSKEYDSAGLYAARYDRTGDEQARSFTKKRMSYLRTHPQSTLQIKDPLTIHVLGSKASGALDAEFAWLKNLESRDHIQITRLDGGMVADIKTSVWIERSDDDAAPLDANLAQAAIDWRKASEPPAATVARQPDPPEAMKTLPLQAALTQYAQIMRSGREGAVAKAADFLALYLRARPEMAFELMKLLEAQSIDKDLESTVFLGLELAGTPEAHEALLQGLGDKHTANNRARAAAALPDIPKPDQKTVEALAATARDGLAGSDDDTRSVRNSATYALGTLEQRARTAHPAVARQAAEQVRKNLARASTDQELSAALDAIGNSGNAEFFPAVSEHFKAREPLVRAHAVQALGQMDPEVTKGAFSELMAAEKDPQLRGTIAVTFSEQAKRANTTPPNEVITAAIAQLSREADPRVRGLLVDLIGPACAKNPAAMAALAAQFRVESDPMLLKLIGKWVPANRLGS